MKYVLGCLFFIISFVNFAQSFDCTEELNELRRLQGFMREGYNSEYIRDREREQHAKYQSCRTKKNNHSSYPKKDLKKHQQTPYYGSSKVENHTLNNYSHRENRPLVSRKSMHIKEFFSGTKQEAWINFYNAPKECLKPKTISQFAECMEHRKHAAETFSKQWDKEQF